MPEKNRPEKRDKLGFSEHNYELSDLSDNSSAYFPSELLRTKFDQKSTNS